MATIFSRPIPNPDETKKLIFSPKGKFPALKSNWVDGLNVLCGHCKNILIDHIPQTISIYRLLIRCPYCKKFSEVNITGDTRAFSPMRVSITGGTPLTGVIALESPINVKPNAIFFGNADQPNWDLDLNEIRSDLANRARHQKEELRDLGFQEKLFRVFHDFAFYCHQCPKSLQKLSEEDMRGLCLILLKTIFNTAEGEAINFNGKADLKITNPENKYEFSVVEFKWWRGPHSFREVFSQCVREHSSGREKSLFILILSSRFNAEEIFKKSVDLFRREPETIQVNEDLKIIPTVEKFCEGMVKIRNQHTPLILGLIDLYFKNV